LMLSRWIRIVLAVCCYHAAVMLFFIYFLAWGHDFGRPSDLGRLVIIAAVTGAGGAALVASRYVVLAVREKLYDELRLPWQLLTPLHGAMLAVIGLFLFKVPVGTDGIQKVGAISAEGVVLVSAIIGFAAEIFVKRLIAVAESLFGEGTKGGTTISSVANAEQGPEKPQL
jgi:hypothetical protein